MFTPAFIDLVGGILEAFPDLIFFIERHRSDILPFFMIFLKFFEGSQDRGFEKQFFRFLAKSDFGFQVLFQVQVLQLFVQLDLIKEFLNQEMIVLPEVVDLCTRNHPDLFPTVLEVFKLIVGFLEGFF